MFKGTDIYLWPRTHPYSNRSLEPLDRTQNETQCKHTFSFSFSPAWDLHWTPNRWLPFGTGKLKCHTDWGSLKAMANLWKWIPWTDSLACLLPLSSSSCSWFTFSNGQIDTQRQLPQNLSQSHLLQLHSAIFRLKNDPRKRRRCEKDLWGSLGKSSPSLGDGEKRESFDRLPGIFLLFSVGYFYRHHIFLCSKFNYVEGILIISLSWRLQGVCQILKCIFQTPF